MLRELNSAAAPKQNLQRSLVVRVGFPPAPTESTSDRANTCARTLYYLDIPFAKWTLVPGTEAPRNNKLVSTSARLR